MGMQLAQEPAFGRTAGSQIRGGEHMKSGFFGYSPGQTWAPSVNVYECEAAYLVCVDLAGVEKETIDLTVADGILRIRGKRPTPLPPTDEGVRYRVHLMEIDHGAFSRSVELPLNVNQGEIEAHHDNGLLWIVLPKILT